MIKLANCAFVSLLATNASIVAQAPTVTRTTKPMFGTAILAAPRSARMDALVDVNHDGKMDAIGFWTSARSSLFGELKMMVNDGRGQLTASGQMVIRIGANNPTPDVFLGDWNGDGKPDFGLDHRTTTFSFFVTTSAGPTIPTFIAFPIAGVVTGVVGADFNRDKKADLAILTTTHFYIVLNSRGYPRTLGFERAGGGTDLRLLDVDNDGEDDLVHLVNGSDVQMLEVHRKAGWTGKRTDTVTYHSLVRTGIGARVKLHPACGDVDGDKDDDVVLFGSNGSYQVLRGSAVGFKQEPWVRGGPATALADVDGDGDLDGICCGGSGGSSGKANYGRARFEVSINDKGKFRPSLIYENIGARHIAGAADMDGDGKVDLVAGRGILFNRGQFHAPVTDWIVGPSRSEVAIRGVGDYDGDGDMDLDHDWALRDQYRNPGDGRVRMISPEIPAAPAGKRYGGNFHYRGDWDGDGDQDLLVAVLFPLQMHVLHNEDGVRYTAAGAISVKGDSLHPFYRTSARQADYFARDLNGDGLDDLITSHQNRQSRIFLNRGNGKFDETGQRLDVQLQDVRDLDGDGYPDAFGMGGSRQVQILFGSKTGTFSSPRTLVKLDAAISFEVADYDADGDVDVFATEKQGTSGTALRVYANTKTGFVAHVLMTGLSSSARLRVRDLDGDGRHDIFITPASGWDSGTVITLRQTATHGFEWSEQMMLEKNFELGDMDGDGDLDVVGDRVLLQNVTHHVPAGGRMQQFGVATKGSRGIRPQLGATGPFRSGSKSSLILRHGVPNGYAVIVIGVKETKLIDFPWLGTNTYVASPLVQILTQLDGAGVWRVSATLPSGLGGSTILYQAYVLDSSAGSGFVTTPGVRVLYGN